ncbi:MAG TPA: hypothetical protein VNL17_00415 [Verrucomicrobiae bacterium]|nr:hypothetical protein [Verrucomicrobiae bacterium]
MTTQFCQRCGTTPATQGVDHLMVCDRCAEVLRRTKEKIQELFESLGNVTPTPSQQEVIESIVAGDSRFSAEIYEFVAEAMEKAFMEWYSQHRAAFESFLLDPPADKETPTGDVADMRMPSKSLVVALQRLASERFGKCATATFNSWGVTRWQDFAEIVSRMQEAKVPVFHLFALNRDDFKSRGALDDVFPET